MGRAGPDAQTESFGPHAGQDWCSASPLLAETDLYRPVKQFLEAQGYVVKGEIGPCDVVAVRGDESPVVVELKERLSLSLVSSTRDHIAHDQATEAARGF